MIRLNFQKKPEVARLELERDYGIEDRFDSKIFELYIIQILCRAKEWDLASSIVDAKLKGTFGASKSLEMLKMCKVEIEKSRKRSQLNRADSFLPLSWSHSSFKPVAGSSKWKFLSFSFFKKVGIAMILVLIFFLLKKRRK